MNPFTLNETTGQYGLTRPASKDEIIDQAQSILKILINKPGTDIFTSPAVVKKFLQLTLAPRQREVFACLFLNNRHHLIEYEELFFGTIDGASVHPREVVKSALRHNSAAVIFCHNHPSHNSEPSQADQSITQRLKDALALVDIRVLDHFIVGEDITSMAERGLI